MGFVPGSMLGAVRDAGQGIVEYALMLGLASIFTVLALTIGGDAVAAFLEAVAEAVGSAT